MINKLSTGQGATLGGYRKIAVLAFGEDSKPVKFLDEQIASSPNGENEEVLAEEGQRVCAGCLRILREPKMENNHDN